MDKHSKPSEKKKIIEEFHLPLELKVIERKIHLQLSKVKLIILIKKG